VLATWIGVELYSRSRAAPTYWDDVAPIVSANCAQCHRPGGSAPFSLLTYADASRRAVQIEEVTQSRFMPPWPPKRGLVKLVSERGLSDSQIETIARWVDAGSPEGSAKVAGSTIRAPDEDGWPLGKPDLVLSMPAPFVLQPDAGRDVFRNFVLSATISAPRWVRAVAIRPENPRLVHHAVVQIDRTHSARYLDARDPEPGFGGMDMGHSEMPEGQWLVWAPGKSFMGTPGVPWRLSTGSDLVLQIHFRPSGKREATRVSVGLYFTDSAPAETPFILWVGSLHIDIPAGEPDYMIERSYLLPVDAVALAIFPHTHYLGRDLRIFATLPSGEMRWLMHIEEWDFNWQDEYRYTEPIPLPAGTRLQIRYRYDNSAANPNNPTHPPRRVFYGQESKDEMASCFLQIKTLEPADRARLAADYRAKATAQRLEDDLRMAEAMPSSSAPWFDVGEQYQAMRRFDDAVRAYDHALQLEPALIQARNNLGLVRLKMGDAERGIEELRRAVELDDRSAEAQANLGAALSAHGDTVEAIAHLTRALEIWPDYADAIYNRGLAHLRAKDLDRAAADLAKTIEIRPEMAAAHNNLGIVLGMRSNDEGAIAEFRAAIRLDPRLREAEQNLAIAIRSSEAHKQAGAAEPR
jgi:tetratricopeptide (TPR) repeat protein